MVLSQREWGSCFFLHFLRLKLHLGTGRFESPQTCGPILCRVFTWGGHIDIQRWCSWILHSSFRKKIPGHKPCTSGHVTTVQELRSKVSDQHLNLAHSASRFDTRQHLKCFLCLFVYLLYWCSSQEISSISRYNWFSCDSVWRKTLGITRGSCKCWWTALLLMQWGLLSMLSPGTHAHTHTDTHTHTHTHTFPHKLVWLKNDFSNIRVLQQVIWVFITRTTGKTNNSATPNIQSNTKLVEWTTSFLLITTGS